MDLDFDVEKTNVSPDDRGIFLAGNPLEKPPTEIIKKGREAVRAYFKALYKESETRPVNEVKVLSR